MPPCQHGAIHLRTTNTDSTNPEAPGLLGSGVRILLSNLAMLGDSQGGVRQFWRPWKKKAEKKKKRKKKEKRKEKSRNYILLYAFYSYFIAIL